MNTPCHDMDNCILPLHIDWSILYISHSRFALLYSIMKDKELSLADADINDGKLPSLGSTLSSCGSEQ